MEPEPATLVHWPWYWPNFPYWPYWPWYPDNDGPYCEGFVQGLVHAEVYGVTPGLAKAARAALAKYSLSTNGDDCTMAPSPPPAKQPQDDNFTYDKSIEEPRRYMCYEKATGKLLGSFFNEIHPESYLQTKIQLEKLNGGSSSPTPAATLTEI